MAPWSLLPWILLFCDALRPREKDGSEGVAALWSGFWVRSFLSCQKLHWSPFEHSLHVDLLPLAAISLSASEEKLCPVIPLHAHFAQAYHSLPCCLPADAPRYLFQFGVHLSPVHRLNPFVQGLANCHPVFFHRGWSPQMLRDLRLVGKEFFFLRHMLLLWRSSKSPSSSAAVRVVVVHDIKEEEVERQ